MGTLNRVRRTALIAGLFGILFDAGAAQASPWQASLESRFDIVDTFDDLEDWTPGAKFHSGAGCATCLSNLDLPRKLDGRPSIWGMWNNKGLSFQYTPQNGTFAPGDVVRGSVSGATATVMKVWHLDGKSYIQLTSNAGVTGRSLLRSGEAITSGTKSGTNLQWPLFIADHGPARTWGGSGKSLVLDLGDNSNNDPTHPTMEGLGAQRLGTYFGDGVSGASGYKKVHVFFMMKISPTFFLSCQPGESGCIQGGYAPVNVVKVFDLMSGFTGVSKWGTSAEAALAGGPNLYRINEYGENFSVFNFSGGGSSFPQNLFFSENIRVSTLTAAGYDYTAPVNGRRMRSGTALDLERYVKGGEWFGVEVAADIGTRGMNDGSTDLWIYDSTGKEMGQFSVSGENRLMNFDHRYNKFVFGGNRLSVSGKTADIDSRWWVDDVVIHGSRIGTTYFQMLAARGTPDPIPTGDTQAPTAAIVSPAANSVVSGVATVSVSATDNVAVTNAELYVDGVLRDSDAAAPFAFTLDTKTIANGSHNLSVRAYDAANNVATSAVIPITIQNVAVDTVAPTISSFSMPATATSRTVSLTLAASDSVGVTGYRISESATTPLASASDWLATIPTSFTFAAAGARTAYAWAKDAAGNVSAVASARVTITLPDLTAPIVTAFTMPATATSRTVSLTLAASDSVGVTGYRISESATTPLASASDWLATIPTSFTFAAAGARTAYAWAKDAAGNVSAVASARVTITLPDTTRPTVTAFSMPAAARSFTVPITVFTGSDNRGVTGYIVTESSTRPLATASGWSATPPLRFTFSQVGVRTAYAWVKDAAGNVSYSSRSAQVIVDGLAPEITSVSPTGGTFRLYSTVAISATARDAIGLSRIILSIDSVQRLEVTSGSLAYSFRPTTRGIHTFTITAYDRAGNRAVRTVSLYVP